MEGSSEPTEVDQVVTRSIHLQPGLLDLDDLLDDLQTLFEQLQLSSVEAAEYEDVLTFATNVAYFGQIQMHTHVLDVYREEEEEEEADDTRILASADQNRGEGQKKEKKKKGNTPPNPNSRRSKKKKGNTVTQHGLSEEDRKKFNADYWYRASTMSLESDSEGSTSDEASSTDVPEECKPAVVPAEIRAVVKDKMKKKQKKIIQKTQTSVSTKKKFIGFVYLDHARESEGVLNVGLIIDPANRGWGYARDALDQVLTIAFETMNCHRVQARIVEGPYKANTLKAVTQLKFTHEGTSRKAFFSPHLQEWKDVTYLALLDTDWVVRESIRVAPLTLWDEMFVRHDKEREDLLQWQKWEKTKASFDDLASSSQTVSVK